MRILIFSPYYPPHVGGLESHSDEFNKHLSQKNVDIVVFTPLIPQNTAAHEIRYNKVKICRFPAFEIIPNYPLPKFWNLKFWKLFFALFRDQFDLIISRTRFFNTSLLAFVYAKIKKVRWIHIEHGSDFVKLSSDFKTFVAKLYDHIFGRLIFKCSDLNISISEAVQEFVKKFDNRQSPIIYRGMDIEKIENAAPDLKFKEQQEGKIIITWVGRLYKWKGVENTVKAIRKLPENIKKEIVFVIIGDGEDFQRLKNLSDESVVMVGNKKHEDAIGILKVSDIYIHSSYPGGGLSTSLLEAMYCGCSIIATPNEGAREVVTDNSNGLLIEDSDAELISDKIEEMLSDRNKMKKLAINAKKQAYKMFSWEKAIDKYLIHLK